MGQILLASGNARKMRTELAQPAAYFLSLGEQEQAMNSLVGENIRLRFNGEIHCVHCQRLTKKSFNQGYCYPCFLKLAECDSCIVSPEKCHLHFGTCRDELWAQTHCQVDHIVYLANSSGLKIGITRQNQVPTRWIDQGAVQAIPLFRTQTRYLSGLVEVAFKQYVADKTHWQAMLKNHVDLLPMQEEKEKLLALVQADITALQNVHGIQAIQPLPDAEAIDIHYPVLAYPSKVKAFNLDKEPEVAGKLMGIKGQYLILDTGVINIRKYTAYHLSLFKE